MKIKLLFFILTIFGSIYATYNDYNFAYLILENPLNLNTVNGYFTPFLGIGTRQRNDSNGFDWNASLELEPLIRSKFKIYDFYLNGNYLHFCKNKFKDFYYGVGFSFLGIKTKEFFYLIKCPTFVIGKEFPDKKVTYITQFKINWPNWPEIWVGKKKYHIPKHQRLNRFWHATIFITTGIKL